MAFLDNFRYFRQRSGRRKRHGEKENRKKASGWEEADG